MPSMTRPAPGPDRRPQRPAAAASRPLLILTAITASCTGPQLQIANPRLDDLYVDGRALPALELGTLPFRYYGSVQWHALPRDDDESMPDFRRLPAAGEVQIVPPVSAWLFPIDLPLELAHRLFFAPNDQTLVVELPERDDQDVAALEITADELGSLRQRAEAARTQR